MLVSRADLLYDHFGVKIASDGYLIELPMLLKGYIPTMDKLPLFLLRLGTEVNKICDTSIQCIFILLSSRWIG